MTDNQSIWTSVNSRYGILLTFIAGSILLAFFLLVDMLFAHVSPFAPSQWHQLWGHSKGPTGFLFTLFCAAFFVLFLLAAIVRLAIIQLFTVFRK